MKILNNIITIDCNYIYPGFACSYLLIEDGHAAFIENNTAHAVPILLAKLKECGISMEKVTYIIITHVHLDHAGGTSHLARACPNAMVLCHQRAARHVIDPEKLIKGATAVYGEKKFKELYGEIHPVSEDRVKVMNDGDEMDFGRRSFKFLYTLGHAKHHMCIHDGFSNSIFTGDSFGLIYPILQKGSKSFVFPSTTPIDFDPIEAIKSINIIKETGADIYYPTHFGPFTDLDKGAAMMIEYLEEMREMTEQCVKSGISGHLMEKYYEEKMDSFFKKELGKRDIPYSVEAQKFLETDIDLNAKGLAYYTQKIKEKNSD